MAEMTWQELREPHEPVYLSGKKGKGYQSHRWNKPTSTRANASSLSYEREDAQLPLKTACEHQIR